MKSFWLLSSRWRFSCPSALWGAGFQLITTEKAAQRRLCKPPEGWTLKIERCFRQTLWRVADMTLWGMGQPVEQLIDRQLGSSAVLCDQSMNSFLTIDLYQKLHPPKPKRIDFGFSAQLSTGGWNASSSQLIFNDHAYACSLLSGQPL